MLKGRTVAEMTKASVGFEVARMAWKIYKNPKVRSAAKELLIAVVDVVTGGDKKKERDECYANL
jgi:hypothetical protein